jgi:protein-disulfide isomerase
LFENQARLNQEVIRTLAAKVNLASNELSKAVDSPRYAAELQEWKEAGREAGVDSTPTLYVNGRKLNLALTADTLERTLQDEMEWISNQGRWAPD